MNSYYIFSFQYSDKLDKESFVTLISDFEIEGVEEKETEVDIYINLNENDNYIAYLESLDEVVAIKYEIKQLENKNWNEIWESNFEQVLINEKIGIRAIFHKPFDGVEKEIIIQPQMSFGTGHHATTSQVMIGMQRIDFKNKKVLDLGSGTAILAIYAEILGASNVLALDNDEWCFNNAKENIKLNFCKYIQPMLGSIDDVIQEKYDIVLANIHKNFHLEQIEKYTKILNSGAYILLSGFYEIDALEILNKALEYNLIANYYSTKDNWSMIVLYNNK